MHSRLRFLAPLVVLFAGAAVVACEDSSGGGSPAFAVPETGAFEAGPGVDGGSTDGAVTDAAPKGVTVTVIERGAPKAGAPVISHDASGAVIGEAVTDAAGKITLATAPSMVTVAYQEQFGYPQVVTVMSVADGDNLVIAPRYTPDALKLADFNITTGASPLVTNALGAEFQVGGECNGSSAALNALVEVYPMCVAAKTAVLANAAGMDGASLAFAFAKDLAKPAQGSIVDVGPLAWAAPGARTIAATNLPPLDDGNTANAFLSAIVGTQRFPLAEMAGSGIRDAAGVIFPTATGFADAYQLRLEVQRYPDSPGYRSDSVVVRREAASASATETFANIDFAAALPLIASASVNAATVARPEVTVTSPAIVGADFAVLQFDWYDAKVEKGGDWTIVAPGNVTTAKAPALPASAATFTPKGQVTVRGAMYVESTRAVGVPPST